MKKLLLSAALVLSMTFSASAYEFDYSSQHAFDVSYDDYMSNLSRDEWIQFVAGSFQIVWDKMPAEQRAKANTPLRKLDVISLVNGENDYYLIYLGLNSFDIMKAGENSEFIEIATKTYESYE